jgi:hypothetical protein
VRPSRRRGIVGGLVTGEAQPDFPRENPGKELRLLLQRPRRRTDDGRL